MLRRALQLKGRGVESVAGRGHLLEKSSGALSEFRVLGFRFKGLGLRVVFASRLTRRADSLFSASFRSSCFDILLSGVRFPRFSEHFFSYFCSFLLFFSNSLAHKFCSSRVQNSKFCCFERVLCWKGRVHWTFTGDSLFLLLFLCLRRLSSL